MKNIYIVGIPRSGKSTLAKLIKENFPDYNQVVFEAIRNGFIESQPELNMDDRNSFARKTILPKHIVNVASWNKKITNNPTLVEGSFCSVEQLSNLTIEDDLIICLGLGCRSLDEIVKGIIENDKENDYTKEWPIDNLKKHFYDIVEEDKNNYSYCTKNNIKYYDTYINRENIFREIIDDIKNIQK